MPPGLWLAQTLSRQILSPADRDTFACQLRPVRIRGRWTMGTRMLRKIQGAFEREVERRRKPTARTRALCSGREAEHAVLAIPFGGCIDQPGQSDAARQPALDRGLDQ